ncbi:MAG: triose-phosphate isomerase [Patescibacteria group bacterium]
MKLIIANWKAYVTDEKAVRELATAVGKIKLPKKTEIVLCPPFIFLSQLAAIRNAVFFVGAQDVFWGTGGAYTGQIIADMLKAFRVRTVIVGHSERRRYAGETDEIVNKKALAALAAGLETIVCVGEQEREDPRMVPKSVGEQVRAALAGVAAPALKKLVIAYEPIWAISGAGGRADTPNDALSAAIYIRKTVGELYGAKSAATLRVLYGGSVNAHNARAFLHQEGIDGLLVGKASTDKKEFAGIIAAGLE